MAVTSARSRVNLKNAGHFDRGNARLEKYTLADELPAQLSQLDLRPRGMSQKLHPGYTLRRLTTDDRDAVLKFLNRFFFRDEPMNQAIDLLGASGQCQELEEYAASSLQDGVSFAAVDDNGDYVGISLNGVVTREEAAELTDKSEQYQDPKFRRIMRVLWHLESQGRVWEKLPESCHTVMEVRIISTHAAWRGRGLMRALCEETERIALDIGATALRMDTTSAFSAAGAERLGYKKVYAAKYMDLPYAPQPPAPHLEARVYLKQLL